jgi:Putative adhesin
MTSTLPLTSTRRLVLLIGVPIMAALIAWGTLSTIGLLGQASYPIGRSIPWNGGAISVAVDDGDLTVLPSTDNSIHVSGVVDYSLVKPTLAVSTSGSSVAIKASCQVGWFGRCSVRISVLVPPAADVTATSASGEVTAANLGDVTLRSDSGDVHAMSLSGVTSLQTDSGDITASSLTSPDISVNDDSGTVSIGFAAIPERVVVQNSSGDVSVTVPQGDQAYNVTAHSDSGDTHIGIPTDPSSTHTISVSVASGNVRIEPNG